MSLPYPYQKYTIHTHESLLKSKKVTLLDALDRVIDKGMYVDGELVLRVADIDLIFIGLRVLITSVSKAEKLRGGVRLGESPPDPSYDTLYIKQLERQLRMVQEEIPTVIDAGTPSEAAQGIAKLVLTLIVFIKELLEKEAMRRIGGGTLTDTEIEKLGLTFTLLGKKIDQLKAVFGITEELNLDLGPLGNLM
jgi:hypothetical protein